MNFAKEGNLYLPKNIIRGGLRKYMEGELNTFTCKFKGRFKVELIDRQGHVAKKLEFDNLITNVGLDFIATDQTGNIKNYAAVGTGSTTPANTDTALVAEISPASTNRTNANGGFVQTTVYTSASPDYWTRTNTYLFDFSQANGNLTEIGLFDVSTAGNMWTRQLFKDVGGSPTTITKTSAYQLRVTYTMQWFPQWTDGTGSVTLNSVLYSYTTRAYNVTAVNLCDQVGKYVNQGPTPYTGAMVSRTSTTAPTGILAAASSTVLDAYVSGNYYRTASLIWNAATVNATIASFVLWSNNGTYVAQIGFTPGIPKDTTHQLQLNFKFAWARA